MTKKTIPITILLVVLSVYSNSQAYMGYNQINNHSMTMMGSMGMEWQQWHEDMGWQQWYDGFDVDLSNDIFTNPERFRKISNGMAFKDDNSDGIVDIVQNTNWFHSMGFGEWIDENEDGIADMFQNREMYNFMGMNNFIDIDGDGLCDNYEFMPIENGVPGMMNMFETGMIQHYEGFNIDTSNDVFTNANRFMEITNGMPFVDDNRDGIVDLVQNTSTFHSMGFGEWIDENKDGIADMFQNREMYNFMGMSNFFDVDGDGICDNYVRSPRWMVQ